LEPRARVAKAGSHRLWVGQAGRNNRLAGVADTTPSHGSAGNRKLRRARRPEKGTTENREVKNP
jgi:hypothetical protein